jgi:hypothetical protein
MRGISAFAFALLASLAANPAAAGLIVYTGTLSGDQESPAVVSNGTGSTVVTYDDVTHMLRVQVQFSGLTGLTTASHIHIRPDLATPNGGVATQVPTFAGFPLGVQAGNYDNTFDLLLASSWNPAFINNNGGTAAGAEAAFLAGLNSGRGYLNVHTNFAPGGEIRANLRVPEPSAWAMLLAGFAVLVVGCRRQSQAR